MTILRFLASPILAWLLLEHRFRAGLSVVFAAGLTDWLDGYTARRLGITGKVGVILDPLADKALLVTLYLVLGVVRLIPVWLLVLVIGRDLVIVGGSVLVRIFRNIRKFVPTILGKISTFFQIVFVLLVLIRAAAPYQWLLWLEILALMLTTVFTTLSGLDYVRRGIIMARQPPVPTLAQENNL